MTPPQESEGSGALRTGVHSWGRREGVSEGPDDPPALQTDSRDEYRTWSGRVCGGQTLPALILSGRERLACFAFYHRAVSKDAHILLTVGKIHLPPILFIFSEIDYVYI